MLIFITLMGASLVFAAFTFIAGNFIIAFFLAVISLFLSVVAFSTKYYTYLYLPAFKSKKKDIVVSNREPYILSPSGTAIIMNEGSDVYATCFIKIPIYRSGTEMNAAEKLDLARLFGRILSITKNTIKISSQLYIVNKDEYIARIRTRLDQAEERMRGISPEQTAKAGAVVERAKGEVSMWHNLLNSISSAKSESLLTYAMVSAVGGNEEEANGIALQRAEEMAAGISSILGVSAFVAKGDEILTLIEPDYMVPVETVNEMIRQKSIEEGI